MTPAELAAIRAHDAAYDACATCGLALRGPAGPDAEDDPHRLPLARCIELQAATFGRSCPDPSAHHVYAAGGLASWAGEAEQDRRALLGAIDEAIVALAAGGELPAPDWLATAAIDRRLGVYVELVAEGGR